MTEEVTPVRTYLFVAAGLVVLTLATIGSSFLPLGRFHMPVALTFATLKALLVVMYFMNVRHSGPLMKIVIIVALFWLGILIAGTLDDYLTRTWLSVPGH
jgi:cytochrome c oxidase subunit IV